MEITRATESEAELLAELVRTASRDVAVRFGLTPDNCPRHPSNCTVEWIRADFARGVEYYLLDNGRAPTGCVAMEPADSGTCYLERLAVLPEKRRRGYGRRLVEHVLKEAGNRAFRQVGIGTIASHGELLEWYRKIGFVAGETRRFEHLPFEVTFMTYHIPAGE